MSDIVNNGSIKNQPFLVVTIILLVGLLGLGGFIAWKSNNISTSSQDSESEEMVQDDQKFKIDQVVISNEGDLVTRKDPKTNLIYQVPKDWPEPYGIEEIDGPITIPNYEIIFAINDPNYQNISWKSISISNFSEIEKNEIVNPRLEKLKLVYNNKSTSMLSQAKNDHISIPDANAATIAYSKPEYIENSDGTLRGLFYFAAIGQDNTNSLSLIADLTDGKSKVVELRITPNKVSEEFTRNYKNRFDVAEKKYSETGQYDELQPIFEEYYQFVKTISSKSTTESIVSDYNSTYTKVIRSLKFGT